VPTEFHRAMKIIIIISWLSYEFAFGWYTVSVLTKDYFSLDFPGFPQKNDGIVP
jgi:hypothetical protein